MDNASTAIVTLPNLITLVRLVIVPATVWSLIAGYYDWAFWLFVAAGVGDALDGTIARQFGMVSRLGSFLDPMADKALLVSIYITLAALLHLPAWLAIMVVSRDLLIVAGVILALVLGWPVEMRPLPISKANTLAQIVLAAVVLADLAFFELDLAWIRPALTLLVAALTIGSATAYLIDWVRHMGRSG
jgi:cardiolipin synthase